MATFSALWGAVSTAQPAAGVKTSTSSQVLSAQRFLSDVKADLASGDSARIQTARTGVAARTTSTYLAGVGEPAASLYREAAAAVASFSTIPPTAPPPYLPPISIQLPPTPVTAPTPIDQYRGEGGTPFGFRPDPYILPPAPDDRCLAPGTRCGSYAPPPVTQENTVAVPLPTLPPVSTTPTETCPPGFHRVLVTLPGIQTAVPRYRCVPNAAPALGDTPVSVPVPSAPTPAPSMLARVPLVVWIAAGVGGLLLLGKARA